MRRQSFTLVEIMVVIVIIAVLAGLTFKMIQVTRRNSDKAKTIKTIEMLSHAIEEFRAEYGQYPPVEPNVCKQHSWDCRLCYVHEYTNYMSDWLRLNYLPDPAARSDSACEQLWNYGLLAFLIHRESGGYGQDDAHLNNLHEAGWIKDMARDSTAKKRWQHFLAGLYDPNPSKCSTTNFISGQPAINGYHTVLDAWDNPLRYCSDPPYMSYELWSVGPDDTDNTADDIHKDKWDN